MKKFLLLTLLISLQFFITGCELFQDSNPAETSKELPCGSPGLGKESTDKIMTQQNLMTTDLVTEICDEYIKVGTLSVKNECGSCLIDIQVLECWEVLDMKVWIGKNLIDLKNLQANPANFPDYTVLSIGNGLYRVVYPYAIDWYCNDNLNIAVWAKVKNTCIEDCGEEIVNGYIGKWDFKYGSYGIEIGEVKVSVVNNYLKVEYDLDYPWTIKEANLEIEDKLSDVPASNDVPIPANFDYHHTGAYYSNNTFSIPLSLIKSNPGYICGESNLFALAHAIVKKPGKEETGWAGYQKFSNNYNKWAKYFTFKIPCGEIVECEYDSWAKGPNNQEFKDHPINIHKWGWYNKFLLLCN